MSAKVLFRRQYGDQCIMLGWLDDDLNCIESFGWVTPNRMPEYRAALSPNDVRSSRFHQHGDLVFFGLVLPWSLFAEGLPTLAFRCSNTAKVFLRETDFNVASSQDPTWSALVDFASTHCSTLYLSGATMGQVLQHLKILKPETRRVVAEATGQPRGAFEEVLQGCAIGWVQTSDDSADLEILVYGQNRLLGFGNATEPRLDLKLMGLGQNVMGYQVPLSPFWVEESPNNLVVNALGGILRVQPTSDAILEPSSTEQSVFLLLDYQGTLGLFEDEVKPRLSKEIAENIRFLLEKLQVCIERADPLARGLISTLMVNIPDCALLKIKRAEVLVQHGDFRAAIEILSDDSAVSLNGGKLLKFCTNIILGQYGKTVD